MDVYRDCWSREGGANCIVRSLCNAVHKPGAGHVVCHRVAPVRQTRDETHWILFHMHVLQRREEKLALRRGTHAIGIYEIALTLRRLP